MLTEFKKEEHIAIPRAQLADMINRTQLPKWFIAEKSGIHITTLRRWLNGRITHASRNSLNRLVVFCQAETNQD